MAISIAPMQWPSTAKAALTPTEAEMKLSDKWVHPPCPAGTCAIPLQILIAFDGTNNNMERDLLDRGHTNVARLFRAFPDVKGVANLNKVGHYRYYIPGVGTPFPDNKEWRESPDGKSQGTGARERVMMGIASVFNGVYRYLQRNTPLLDGQALTEFIQEKVAAKGTAAASWAMETATADVYREMHRSLDTAFRLAASEKPAPGKLGLGSIDVHVFGFSRGSMQAVAYCHEFARAFPKGTLSGVPISIKFLGLMDCVASVGIADNASRMNLLPATGHSSDGIWVTKPLPGCVKKAVHFVAAHEQRFAFPLDLVQGADMDPYVYPGVHSNVGGGYGRNAQGKAPQDGLMLSQIPLMHMYRLAYSYGVPLLPYPYMDPAGQQDFELDKRLAAAWNSYMESLDFDYVRDTQGDAAAKPFYKKLNPNGIAKCTDYKALFRHHMRMRYSQMANYLGATSVIGNQLGTVSPQAGEDLRSSISLLDYDRALMGLYLGEGKKESLAYTNAQRARYEQLQPNGNMVIADFAARGTSRHYAIASFEHPGLLWGYQQLDGNYHNAGGKEWVFGTGHLELLHQYVNDSLAGFYLLGFSSNAEKAEKIEAVVAKQQAGHKLNRLEKQIYANYSVRAELMEDTKYKEIIAVRLRDKSKMEAAAYQKKWAYTPEESNYLAGSRFDRTVIPLLTDADAPMLLEDQPSLNRVAITSITRTRREGGGYLLGRGVFISGKRQTLVG